MGFGVELVVEVVGVRERVGAALFRTGVVELLLLLLVGPVERIDRDHAIHAKRVVFFRHSALVRNLGGICPEAIGERGDKRPAQGDGDYK